MYPDMATIPPDMLPILPDTGDHVPVGVTHVAGHQTPSFQFPASLLCMARPAATPGGAMGGLVSSEQREAGCAVGVGGVGVVLWRLGSGLGWLGPGGRRVGSVPRGLASALGRLTAAH
jgi:hypothetical protein